MSVATLIIITRDRSSGLFFLEGLPDEMEVDPIIYDWLDGHALVKEVSSCFAFDGKRMRILTTNCDASYRLLEREQANGLDLYGLEEWTMKGAWA